MNWISDPHAWLALVSLTALEIVLGVDNIIFISILAGKLPVDQQPRARFLGLLVALLSRVALLFSLTWVMQLTEPLFSVFSNEISGRDLILMIGGLFLIGKSTHEIHDKLEGAETSGQKPKSASFTSIIIQIAILDLVFSLDSVITAIGMANQIGVMITAVILAVIFMMVFAGSISDFVHRHPTVKMLALSFLLLIGVTLVAESLDQHIAKSTIYFAMAFSIFVEFLNIRIRKKSEPVHLKEPFVQSHTSKS